MSDEALFWRRFLVQASHSGSEEFKRKRARYMRLKYRPNLKAREKAAKRIATEVRKGK